MKKFFKWLFRLNHDECVRQQQKEGDLRQVQQQVDSSRRRLERASRENTQRVDELTDSTMTLKTHLDTLSNRLKALQDKAQ